jgi:hypothetical protein
MTAAQLALISAGSFFLAGLLTGVWKYAQIATSEEARAHYYVDIAHRASLMYAFACLLLERFAQASAWSESINFWGVAASVLFFALAVASYVLHGMLKDTRNQLRRPHKLGPTHLPGFLMVAFMVALIVAEVGGFMILFTGYLKTLCG